MRAIDRAAIVSTPDTDVVEAAIQQIRAAVSFSDTIRLTERLFTEDGEFEAWRGTMADLYYMLLHAHTAKIALDLGCSQATPQGLMGYLDGVEGGRQVNRFFAPDAPVPQHEVHFITKALLMGTLLREIKVAADSLSAQPDAMVRKEAQDLLDVVHGLGVIFADLSAGLLAQAGFDLTGRPTPPAA